MYERDRVRNNGETDTRDIRDDRGAGVRGGRESDYEGSAHQYGGAITDNEQEFPRNGFRDSWAREAVAEVYPDEDEGALPGYAGAARSAPRANRFLDEASIDYDDPLPAKPAAIRAVWFFLLMAAIGASAGALWFYFDPDLGRYVPGFSSANADRTTELLIRLVDGQTKLTQSVTAIQPTQDALQKTIAAREQELQRLLAETQALRSDINALRTGLAEAALRSHPAQSAKGAPAATKRTKAEAKSVPQREQPQNETAPSAPAPSQ
jgi:hypothetical protein